jgi:hypothetical protein
VTQQDQIAKAKRLVEQGYSRRAAAAEVGLPESTLRYHLNGRSKASGRNALEEVAGVSVDGDSAVLVGLPTKRISDPHKLMIEMGFNPDDWEVVGDPVINRWGDPSSPSYQLKLRIRERNSVRFVTPAVHVPPVERPPAYLDHSGPSLGIVLGDQQIPFHDPAATELTLQWLEINQPEFGVLTGDTMDLGNISRHKDNPEWDAPVQECVDASYRYLRNLVEASPSTRWVKLLGNHDERIRSELLLRAERLYGVTPAPTEEDPNPSEAFSVRRLLHLDTLGIDLIEPNGGYQNAQHSIADKLVVRHGWLTGANAPLKTLQAIDFSVIFGHTHRQSITKRTIHDQDGQIHEQVAVETGCLCRIEGGLGYAVDPSWQKGFATATIWDSGGFNVELAKINDSDLRWRDERYKV